MSYENNYHGVEPFKFDVTEILDNMSNAEYHSRTEISSSFVKSTWKHSVGRALQPLDQEMFALQFGDAFHEFMELGNLSDRFAIKPEKSEGSISVDLVKKKYGYEPANKDIFIPEGTEIPMVKDTQWDGRTKMGKAWISENSGKIILEKKHVKDIDGMHESVMNIPLIKNLLENPDLERRDEWSFFADGDCPDTKGMKFRVRPDVHFWNEKQQRIECIIDWKTCNDMQKLIKWGFIRDYAYHIQAVFYCDIMMIDPRKFIFICVEKEPPYSARPFRLTDETIYQAREDIRKTLHRISAWQSDPTQNDIDLPKIIEI